MIARLIRLLAAAPLVALLGAAMALAAGPDGDVTARERELHARLTRGGVQRLDADGGHWTADLIDAAGMGASASDAAPDQHLAATVPPVLRRVDQITMLDHPAAGPRTGRPSAPPSRDRAPPRS